MKGELERMLRSARVLDVYVGGKGCQTRRSEAMRGAEHRANVGGIRSGAALSPQAGRGAAREKGKARAAEAEGAEGWTAWVRRVSAVIDCSVCECVVVCCVSLL